MSARTLQSVRSELAEGYRFVSGNKLVDAQVTFRSVLQALLLVVISSDEEAKQVRIPAFVPLSVGGTYRVYSGETL